jgi:hypothetical protein
MTHTLNRRGLSETRSGEEIVVLCMVHQKEKGQKTEAMRKIAKTVLKYSPDNIIGAPLCLKEEAIEDLCVRAGIVTAVFNKKSDVLKMVEEIKSERIGISVVLSGLFKDVREICSTTNLREHTYNISLGVFGKTGKVPDEKILEITTQCGHALISPLLVKDIVKKIKKGKMTLAEGTNFLTKPCVCGIVNPKRTQRVLEELTNNSKKNENRA